MIFRSKECGAFVLPLVRMSTSTEYDWKVSIPPLPRRGITLQLIVPPSAAYGSPAIDMPALLQAWDKASPQSTIRFTLITDFLAAANKLNPANDALELEKITRSRASLFLTRIITWIKLVYTTPNILLQVCFSEIHLLYVTNVILPIRSPSNVFICMSLRLMEYVSPTKSSQLGES